MDPEIPDMTDLKYGFLLNSILYPSSSASATGFVVELQGCLDADRLHQAVDAIVQATPVLRSRFRIRRSSDGEPVFERTSGQEPESFFHTMDLTRTGASDERLEQIIHDLTFRGYRPEKENLVRFTLIKRSSGHFYLVISAHHAVVDGTALELLARDILSVYASGSSSPRIERAATGHTMPPDPALQNRQQSLNPVTEHLLAHSESTRLSLPCHQLSTHSIHYDSTLSRDISRYCRQKGITPALFFKVAYSLLIRCYTRACDDFIFTEVIGERDKHQRTAIDCLIRKALWHIPGSLYQGKADLDTLFRYFKGWHRRIRQQSLYLTPEQNTRLHKTGTEFVFNFYAYQGAIDIPDLTCKTRGLATPLADTAQLIVTRNPDSTFTTTLCADTWCRQTGFLQRLQAVARQVISGQANNLQQLSWLTPEEFTTINRQWNNTDHRFDVPALAHQRFERQAQLQPDAVAVSDSRGSFTYRELDHHANQIAHRLLGAGLVKGASVCTCLPRSRKFLAAILGTLKAGGAYVPVDMDYPPARILQILNATGPGLVICEPQTFGEILPDPDHTTLIAIDDPLLRSQTTENPAVAISGQDSAYIIFTSGSTGTPKGAINNHDGMLNHIDAELLDLNLGGPLTMLQNAPAASDISVWQFIGPVVDGGRCVIIDKPYDIPAIYALVRQHDINLVEVVPTVLDQMCDYLVENNLRAPDSLRKVMVTGEAVDIGKINRWLELHPHTPIVNAYGPSEAADDVIQHTFYERVPANSDYTPIGKPLANLKAYIMDDELRLLPPGVPGEICIGGVGVGKGYLNDPVKTRQAFINNPYGAGRLYKTGDLGYWRVDGSVVYVNRRDFQLNMNGYRIEPAEIELKMMTVPGVVRSLVVAVPVHNLSSDDNSIKHNGSDNHHQRLLAYYQASTDIRADDIRKYLVATLPAHMIPDDLIRVSQFNYTPNGKIDRKRLPVNGVSATQLEPPKNALEEELVGLWKSLLKRESVSTDDNFLRLGGNSLTAARIASRLNGRYRVTVKDVLKNLTIRELAAHLASQNIR